MAFTLQTMIPRLRSRVDSEVIERDDISQDGTSYNIELTAEPIVSGSDSMFITHTTFTSGLNQRVWREDLVTLSMSSGIHLTYTIDYDRGEVELYQGSGLALTGMSPFAPWNTSTLTVKYKSVQYTDDLLADYLGFAVSSVETSLQLGMYVSGIRSGISIVPPTDREPLDVINQFSTEPYRPDEKFVIAEDVEILQDLIASKAAFDLISRERRIGAGDAIKIVDGDTQIDTSVNQRYMVDLVRDLEKEYKDKLKWVMHNMLEGYTLLQIDEQAGDYGGYNGRYNL